MTDVVSAKDEPEREDIADETFGRVEVAPEAEQMRRAFEGVQRLISSQIRLPALMISQSMLRDLVDAAGIVDEHRRFTEHMAAIAGKYVTQQSALIKANLDIIATSLARDINFAGLAANIVQAFAAQQSALLRNFGPALAAMQARFYPRNLRSIEGLQFESVNEVVMVDGIPLYGLPRASISEALVRAADRRVRREILGRRWKMVSADCREVVVGLTSAAAAPYVPFALAALDALDAEHSAAAQALAGSLVDTIVADYFGSDRYRYTPSTRNTTAVAYEEFTIREFVAFAPIWQAYQQFRKAEGDQVPTAFNRHATVHTVSQRQYNRRNAVQGLMLVCSLLHRVDEEAMSASRPV